MSMVGMVMVMVLVPVEVGIALRIVRCYRTGEFGGDESEK
jgi:predicted Na+-dependent transporter